MATNLLERHIERVDAAETVPVYGKVREVAGLTIEATGPAMRIGDLCYVKPSFDAPRIPVEVVGFRNKRILLMPLEDMRGIGPDDVLIPTYRPQSVLVGDDLLGRVVDCMGTPLDGGPAIRGEERVELIARGPGPLERRRIVEPLATGIRAVDACVTCGKGQRVGILSGSGIGKSKFIGMTARNTNADIKY